MYGYIVLSPHCLNIDFQRDPEIPPYVCSSRGGNLTTMCLTDGERNGPRMKYISYARIGGVLREFSVQTVTCSRHRLASALQPCGLANANPS